MVDVFGEIDEQVRSDRIAGLARQYLPWALGVGGVALAAALVAWGLDARQTQATEKASQVYAQGVDSAAHGDTAGALAKFELAADAGSRPYRTLALMQEAGIKLDAGATAQAVSLLDDAAKDAPNLVLGDAARLKSALALLDTASLADLETRLTPLTDAKHPYRALAREALAMAKMRAGRFAEARNDFNLLKTSLDAPDDMRERAGAAMTLIDEGAAASIAPTVKAAIALPPQAAASAPQTPQPGAAQ